MVLGQQAVFQPVICSRNTARCPALPARGGALVTVPGMQGGCGNLPRAGLRLWLHLVTCWDGRSGGPRRMGGSGDEGPSFIPFLALPQQVSTFWAAENISSLFSPSPEAGSPQSEHGQSRGFSRGRGEDASCSSGHFLAGVRVTLVSASILTSLWASPQSACAHISLFL